MSRKRLPSLAYPVELPRQSTALGDTLFEMHQMAKSRSDVTGRPSHACFRGNVTINGEDIEVVISVNSKPKELNEA